MRWSSKDRVVHSDRGAFVPKVDRLSKEMLAQPDEEDVETVPARVPPGLAGLHRAQAAWLRFRHSAVITPPRSWSAREHCSRHPVGDAETAAARRG
ncbi:hypothetical protein CHLRE_01g051137v5 [Chlamydomonas reinhardtii]|uniref:Uncharacterized protein n=1 Tax=Chlamydomonas reinhardtii TaxID=3055 RepID=A0A2K3E820_CHLRE|nr:uncharacterized protein CHLRE_01g051137v5 [Chlamydomonas reinhardtii]PNW88933.1 hypothetical protein CHLRE_01g051137v5 [Chlamydomonas reinhardtii]